MLKTKVCKNCSTRKLLSFFSNDRNSKDGLKYYCKSCRSGWGKIYYKENRKKLISVAKTYAEKNRNKVKEKQRLYYHANKEKLCAASLDHYYKNQERQNALHRRWTKDNKDKVNEYQRKRRHNNISIRISHGIGTGIWKSVKENKNGRHWESLVGYNLKQLKQHIQKLFQAGMTWENYGEWHIDHIIPIAAFNFTNPEHEDFKRCWSLKNLQPMWAIDNLKKGSKLGKPFQQSLIL